MQNEQPNDNHDSELKKACDEIQAKREADEKAREERRAEHLRAVDEPRGGTRPCARRSA